MKCLHIARAGLNSPLFVVNLTLHPHPSLTDDDDLDDVADANNEMDLEISQWGDANRANSRAQYVRQPFTSLGNVLRFDIPSGGTEFAFVMTWQPDYIDFALYSGHREEACAYAEAGDASVHSADGPWSFRGNQFGQIGTVPTPAAERVHLNLWLADTDEDGLGNDPACGIADTCSNDGQNGATRGIRVDVVGFAFETGMC
eukprot:SAG31_NODE_587_length_13828_cov_2.438779_3_plen_201_part_00